MRPMLACLLVLLPLPTAAQDSRTGWKLAERWCMACHVIEREPPSAMASGIPSFSVIARRPDTTPESLDRYLSTGHTRMPDFSLSRDERGALIGYILDQR